LESFDVRQPSGGGLGGRKGVGEWENGREGKRGREREEEEGKRGREWETV